MRNSLIVLLMTLAILLATGANAIPKADLWAIWDAHDPASKRTVDHSAWQAFLDRYLSTGEDAVNRMDYRRVQPAHRAALNDYLASLSRIDPRTLNRRQQLAYWINLYNALTAEVVLRNPGKRSILRMGKGFFSIGPWDDELLSIAGEPMTLNDIEHRILRPIWRDHRIHYAVNCASISCPNLSTEAYRGDNVHRLLDAAEAAYINHDRGVMFTDKGKLRLSSIYKWYRQDFAMNEPALLAYLAQHHKRLGERLERYARGIDYKYDWNLNSRSEP